MTLGIAHAAALIAGILAGILLSIDLPDVQQLDPLQLPQMTTILDRHGDPVRTFAEQQRIIVPLTKISPLYVSALISTEDPRFESHLGVDPQAIARALLSTIRNLRWGVEGGSTITQQLARLYFLHPRKTLLRKLQEAYLSFQIEKCYSKDEILTLYSNSIYLGHGQYGVEAAAHFYFDIPAKDLTLEQAALLAGITRRPESLTPLRHPDLALRRRNHVLTRMVEEGRLGETEAAAARNAPLGLNPHRTGREFAPFYVEEVRRDLLARFGEKELYNEGLMVRTALDPELQRAAERAVRGGLNAYGKRHKKVPQPLPLPAGTSPDTYQDPSWNDKAVTGDVITGLVLSSSSTQAAVKLGTVTLGFGPREIAWTGRIDVGRLLPPGTLIPVLLTKVTSWGQIMEAQLGAEPDAEAALVALDPRNGEVLALVGGHEFGKSEFDRAMQAERQAGSSFKPFVMAAAIETGFSPQQPLWDVPTVFRGGGGGNYQPENYDHTYDGLVTLRHTLEQSRNIPTVRLLDAVGYQPAVDLAKRVGISTNLQPYPSLALGAFEVRLIELASAYACFANGGVLIAPRMLKQVDSTEGTPLFADSPVTSEAIRPETASIMTSLLQGVVQRGTARNALSLGRPLAGKTGTTDDYTDAWFVGYTPSLVAAVWIGHDQRVPLGRGESGAVAALPIWIEFMQDALANKPREEFASTGNLVRRTFDRRTGKLASDSAGCTDTITEYVPANLNDLPTCTPRDHIRASLPYPLQMFPIQRDGSLMLPVAAAIGLVGRQPDRYRVIGQGDALQFKWGDRTSSVPLAWTNADWQRYLNNLRPADLDDLSSGGTLDVVQINRSGRKRMPTMPLDPN